MRVRRRRTEGCTGYGQRPPLSTYLSPRLSILRGDKVILGRNRYSTSSYTVLHIVSLCLRKCFSIALLSFPFNFLLYNSLCHLSCSSFFSRCIMSVLNALTLASIAPIHCLQSHQFFSDASLTTIPPSQVRIHLNPFSSHTSSPLSQHIKA